MQSRYHETYAAWQRDPKSFWREAAKAIDWHTPPQRIFDPTAGVYGRWFPDARGNMCFNAVDRHADGFRASQVAFYYDSPVTQTQRTITYAELKHEVATLAAVFVDHGVGKGDRVIIYMPMIPEAIFAMLACARIGAVHSVVFGGFAAKELATRLDDAQPKLVLAASCGIESARVVPYKSLLDDAIAQASVKPAAVILFQRPQAQAPMTAGRDYDWAELVAQAKALGRTEPCVAMAATDPLYILYTSGTTGIPKGVVRDIGGHMVSLAWTMENFYGVKPGEAFWTASDIGWVVGHSYIVYAPLLCGCASVIYEGKPVGTPDAGAFWRVIADYGVVAFFTAPTALRAIRKEDPDARQLAKYDLSKLRTLFLAGERADPATIQWAEQHLKIPVIDHWWQTETGYGIAGNCVGLGQLPVKHGSPSVPLPGWDVQVVDEAAKPVARNAMGSLVIKLPLPPGAFVTLWRNDKRMHESYLNEFPGFYNTADAGYIDDDGYVYVMGRTDDIINVAGHRLSTGGMEEVLASHPDVTECAVVGLKDALKGEAPCGFVVLKVGVTKDAATIEKEIVALVRERIGPVAAFKMTVKVDRLPKTRSGKILRATMKKIADGDPWTMPATIDDPAVLDEIKNALAIRATL